MLIELVLLLDELLLRLLLNILILLHIHLLLIHHLLILLILMNQLLLHRTVSLVRVTIRMIIIPTVKTIVLLIISASVIDDVVVNGCLWLHGIREEEASRHGE